MFDLESATEKHFCRDIVQWARDMEVTLFVIKLNLKGRRGWPDRLLIWDGGGIMFIEFKREGECPRALQEYIHGMLRAMGFTVETHDNAATALHSVQTKVRATAFTDQGDALGRTRSGLPPVPETGTGQDGGSS